MDDRNANQPDISAEGRQSVPPTSQCIDWYAEGESRTVEVDGRRVTVKFVGRKGRRGRIAIIAPPGATFRSAQIPCAR